jgi:murein DD-endopeptidase MepM/ murein hydrolase activator NlpD
MTVNERACGFGLVLDGDDGRRWTLCHFNAAPVVDSRDRVAAGDVVGVVGASGNATWVDRHGVTRVHPHLHISAARLTATDRVMGEPENIYRELLDAQAVDMGHRPIEPTPETRLTESPRGARARRPRVSNFAGFAIVAGIYWYARRKRSQ